MAGEGATLIVPGAHTEGIRHLEFSPSGRWLISAGGDGVAKLWDVERRKLVRNYPLPAPRERSDMIEVPALAAFDHSERYLITAGGLYDADRRVDIHQLDSSQDARQLDYRGDDINSIATHPTLDLLAIAGDGVEIWNIVENEREARMEWGVVRMVAYSPDGRFLAVGGHGGELESGERLVVHELATNTIVSQRPHPFPKGIINGAIAFDPNSRWLASIDVEGRVIIHDLMSQSSFALPKGIPLRDDPYEMSHTRAPLAFSPDGTTLAAGGDDGVRLWELERRQVVADIGLDHEERLGVVQTLAFSPDGALLAIGTEDRGIWLLETTPPYRGDTLGVPSGGFEYVTLAKGGGSVLFVSEHTLTAWDLTRGGRPRSVEGGPWKAFISTDTAAISQSGDLVAAVYGDDTLEVYSLSLGEKVLSEEIRGSIIDLGLSPQGDWVAVASARPLKYGFRDSLELFNLRSGKRRVLEKWDARFVAFSGDGSKVASVSSSLDVWDVDSGTKLRSHPMSQWETALSMSHDGRWVAVMGGHVDSSDGARISVWDNVTGDELVIECDLLSFTIALSPDGSMLAIVDERDIGVFHVPTGNELWRTRQNVRYLEDGLEFSANGRTLIAAGDGFLDIWSVSRGEHLARLALVRNGDRIDWVAFDRDGFFDGSPESWSQVSFSLDSDPLRIHEPEQFFSQFFQPGMIEQIVASARPVRALLAEIGDPRSSLDISQYLDSKIPRLDIGVRRAKNVEFGARRTIPLLVEATDTGSGLRDLRVFRNGVLVHLESGELSPGAPVARFEIPVTIREGRNVISASVFNRDDLKSKDVSIVIDGTRALRRTGRAHILAVGINDYSRSRHPNLAFAMPDSGAFAAVLRSELGALTDIEVSEPIVLHNTVATKKRVMLELARLRSVEPEDMVFIYFGGHGTADGERYGLVMSDDEVVWDDELELALQEVDAEKMMLIVDACESGQMLASGGLRHGPLNYRGMAQLAYEKSMYVLMGSQAWQPAMEATSIGSGLLTHALLRDGLRLGLADRNPGDGRITAAEWFDYAVSRVPELHASFATPKGTLVSKGMVRAKRAEYQRPRAYYPSEPDDDFVIARLPRGPRGCACRSHSGPQGAQYFLALVMLLLGWPRHRGAPRHRLRNDPRRPLG